MGGKSGEFGVHAIGEQIKENRNNDFVTVPSPIPPCKTRIDPFIIDDKGSQSNTCEVYVRIVHIFHAVGI